MKTAQKITLSFIVGLFFASISAQDIDSKNDSKNNAMCGIAVISIETDINASKPIIAKLLQISKDDCIKGIIIHMNSFGGKPGTCEAIYRELKKIKKRKPIIICIENCCYSGAYYVAVAADYIFALNSSELGSIGIKYTIKKYKDLKFSDDHLSGNVEYIVLRTGHFKDICNPYIPLDNEYIDCLKDMSQKQYNHFIKVVAESRNISITDEKKWADGKEFVGSEALELGLIDAIGDFSDALEKMKELLQVRGGIAIHEEFEIIDIKI